MAGCITSGQLPLNPNTNHIKAEGIHDQVLQCLENIRCILQSEQMDFSKVLKLTVYMTDLTAFSQVNHAFMESIARPYPARTAVQISALPLGANVESEAIALGGQS